MSILRDPRYSMEIKKNMNRVGNMSTNLEKSIKIPQVEI